LYQKLAPSKDAKKIYIFCEGEKREFDYFSYFGGFVSNINIIPIPSSDGETDPEKLKGKSDEYFSNSNNKISEEYKDMVWFVIDTDNWNQGNKIGALKSYCASKNQGYNAWFVAQSNPSFEIWLYYHFFDKKPDAVKVGNYASFKEYVHHEIPGGFDSRKYPAIMNTAIKNAEINFEEENGQPEVYTTQVFRLAKPIWDFTGDLITKLYNP
jgi:hypothetical protein